MAFVGGQAEKLINSVCALPCNRQYRRFKNRMKTNFPVLPVQCKRIELKIHTHDFARAKRWQILYRM